MIALGFSFRPQKPPNPHVLHDINRTPTLLSPCVSLTYYPAMSDPATAQTPFKLAVPDPDIDLLQKKLELVRFPDELDSAGWDYGAPLADVKRLTAHWKHGFDWRKTEAEINKLPMFTRDIEVDGCGTLNVHFVHQVSEVKGAIPLLFVHGCKWQYVAMEVGKRAHSCDL